MTATTPPPDAGQPEITERMRQAGANAVSSWIANARRCELAAEAAYRAMRSLESAPLAPPHEVTRNVVGLRLGEMLPGSADEGSGVPVTNPPREVTEAMRAPARERVAKAIAETSPGEDWRGWLDAADWVLRALAPEMGVDDASPMVTDAMVEKAWNAFNETENDLEISDPDDNLTDGVYSRKRYDPVTRSLSEPVFRCIYKSEAHEWVENQKMRAALNAALNAPARVDENALNELLEPLGEPWEYKGSDVAWQILYRWHKTMRNRKGYVKDAVTSLFLRADGGGLHLLARAINAAFLQDQSELSEMRDIRGGEVGEITRTPEEQAALERAMGDVGKP